MNKRKLAFPIGLLIYGLVFLLLMAVGLGWLWRYMEDFERSRPHTALNDYMQQLSGEYVAVRSEALIAGIDPKVQKPEQCRNAIRSALNGEFACVKKGKLSSDDRHVYAVLCGKQVIGTMEMERCGDRVGSFRTWRVIKEDFDLSYLLTQPLSITVPEDHLVYANGNLLTKDYITQDKIPYAPFQGLYEDYTLPYMVTYTAGPFLGVGELTVTDPAGNPVSIDADSDMTAFLNNCTAQQAEQVDAHVEGFVQCYVDYLSRTGGDSEANYAALARYMVPGGELAQRMRAAMDGLSWVTDRGASIRSITIHNRHAMADGRYLWDVSYVVDTKDYDGEIQTTANLKLVVKQTEDGLKTEALKNG